MIKVIKTDDQIIYLQVREDQFALTVSEALKLAVDLEKEVKSTVEHMFAIGLKGPHIDG